MNRNLSKIKNTYLLIFFLSLTLVSLKWIISFSLYTENIDLRIINDTSDYYYYPIIKSFSELKLNPSYLIGDFDLKNISFPYLGLFINSLFLKIFDSYSFILLEFICSFIFLVLIYSIFSELKYSKVFSIFASVLFFILPVLLKYTANLIDINLLYMLSVNFEAFYSLRFPRPAISNLFLFSFIFLNIKFYYSEKKFLSYLFYLSVLMGLSINIFFYHFFIESFLLLFTFILKFKKDFFKIIFNNLKYFILYLVILIIFIIIFQSQIYFSETDYVQRLGVFEVSTTQKKIIFFYLVEFFTKMEFIFMIIINSFFFYLIKKDAIKIFYFLFLSSILSTLIFMIFFNKGVDYYHFYNWIIISGFLNTLIIFLNYTYYFFNRILKINFLFFISLLLIITFYNYILYNAFINRENINKLNRDNLNELTTFISENNYLSKKDIEILNLNKKLATWFILNNYKNFSILPVSFWVPKKNVKLENELISVVKFLGYNNTDFHNLIRNKKSSWRFKNEFMYDFFGRIYMANSLITYKNSGDDFSKIEKRYIKKNNLLIAHQIILPKSEIKRLLNKFDNINEVFEPSLIVIDEQFLLKSKFDNENFCLAFENVQFKIYLKKTEFNNCVN